MKKLRNLMFPAMLAVGLLASLPTFACETGVCADGSTCKGNKSCSCSGGTATCTDYPPLEEATLATSEGLSAYISYLGTINSPEARTLQEAAESIRSALDQNSLADYFVARIRHDKALATLSENGWKALSAGGFLADKDSKSPRK